MGLKSEAVSIAQRISCVERWPAPVRQDFLSWRLAPKNQGCRVKLQGSGSRRAIQAIPAWSWLENLHFCFTFGSWFAGLNFFFFLTFWFGEIFPLVMVIILS